MVEWDFSCVFAAERCEIRINLIGPIGLHEQATETMTLMILVNDKAKPNY
jgi:hypothetical protein